MEGEKRQETGILLAVPAETQPPATALLFDSPEGIARADGHHPLPLLVRLHVVQQRVQHVELAVMLAQAAEAAAAAANVVGAPGALCFMERPQWGLSFHHGERQQAHSRQASAGKGRHAHTSWCVR